MLFIATLAAAVFCAVYALLNGLFYAVKVANRIQSRRSPKD
jgi:hypothetical protein